MRVLVTGATGFVGRRLVEVLRARGDRVTAFSRDADRAGALLGDVDSVTWDPSEAGDWCDAVDGHDAVVHLAGEQAVGSRWNQARKRVIMQSRVRSTEVLVDAIGACARRPAVLVCASGVGFYGARDGDEAVDESAESGSDFLAAVTIAWEHAARKAEAHGVRVVAARLGIVLGRGGGALAQMATPFRLFVGGPIASGRQVVSWIHLDDVARFVSHAFEHDALSGPVNVTAPTAVTNAELSALLGRVLKRPAVFRVPALALRLRFGEGADPLVTGQRAVPRALEASGFEWSHPDLEAALRDALL